MKRAKAAGRRRAPVQRRIEGGTPALEPWLNRLPRRRLDGYEDEPLPLVFHPRQFPRPFVLRNGRTGYEHTPLTAIAKPRKRP